MEIEVKYNKNPKGWNILVGGRDPHGHGNIFISNEANIWQIKLDSLYKPNPHGVGIKLGDVDEFEDLTMPKLPSFGFRPLMPVHLDRLRRTVEQEKPINRILEEIMSAPPVSTNDMSKNNYLMGPIMQSSFKGYISDRQKELDKKLRKNLDSLLLSKGIGYDYL